MAWGRKRKAQEEEPEAPTGCKGVSVTFLRFSSILCGLAIVIDGVEWTEYDIPDPARAGNISAALSTTAGDDTILVYGATDADTLRVVAEGLADQIIAAREGIS